MKSAVFILCSNKPNHFDLSFAKLVDFLGINYKFIYLEDYLSDIISLTDNVKENESCLALSCSTLASIHNNKVIADSFKTALMKRISFLFVYHISPNSSESEALNFLTDGTIRSVSSFPNNDYKYKVSEGFRDICRQFSGLSFGPISNRIDFGFQISEPISDIDNLVSINKQPLFFRIRKGTCDIFALATSQILDIHDSAFRLNNTKEYFSRIMPAVMFLRYVFKEHCWHNDNAQACLTIDDPLLRSKYGFLDYKLLLEAMDHYNFFTTIAFIPWNFRRTSREVASLFKKRIDRFSLCVHGCNHTKHEFGSTDYREINTNVKQATERMNAHEDATGLVFDKVMTFPQGVFSTHSMLVLKSNGYLAAVNGGQPTNNSDPQTIDSLLQPAIMNYENFPLFHRRHTGRFSDKIVDFAFDLFWGKPIILVVHHDYFREGYKKIIESAESINSLAGNIQWKGLGDIIKSSYLQKQEDNNTIRIKQYANNILISNNSSDVTKYIITKEETSNIPIKDVLVNGRKAKCDIVKKVLNMDIVIEPKKTAEIEIVYQDIYHYVKENRRIQENIRIIARRKLSEIRDNYIDKSQLLFPIKAKLGRYLTK